MKVVAIITAAGSSKRLGTGKKKEYIHLGGKPVLLWSMETFLSVEAVERLVVTLPRGDAGKVERMLPEHIPAERISFVEGGRTRQLSVFNALKFLAEAPAKGRPNDEPDRNIPDIVLIHDGARPWIEKNIIEGVIHGTLEYGACIPVIEIPDAVKVVGDSGFILAHPPKNMLFAAQTPQGFNFNEILTAHENAFKDGYDNAQDDAELYSTFFHPVYTVPGSKRNRKITYKEDLFK